MRLPTWPENLAEAIAGHQARPFEWGASDCLIFPLECVRAVTARDLLHLCGEYGSRLAAYRRLQALGFETIADAFAAHFPEIHPAMMGRGDLATVLEDGAVCGAVCVGAGLAGKAIGGLSFIPRARAQRAFKVE
jgi:hypothetical protein